MFHLKLRFNWNHLPLCRFTQKIRAGVILRFTMYVLYHGISTGYLSEKISPFHEKNTKKARKAENG